MWCILNPLRQAVNHARQEGHDLKLSYLAGPPSPGGPFYLWCTFSAQLRSPVKRDFRSASLTHIAVGVPGLLC